MTLVHEQSFLDDISDSTLRELAKTYMRALLDGDRQRAYELADSHLRDGGSIRDVYLSVFQPVQYEVGRLWQLNRVSIAQEHFCTASTQLVMARLYPHVFRRPDRGRTMVGCCAPGELHELGMRMVSDFFEMDGWSSHYLGANIPPAEIIRTVCEQEAEVLAVSATMLYSLHKVKEIVRLLRNAPGGKDVLVLVGGHPFLSQPGLSDDMGADCTALNAAAAVETVNVMLEGR